MADLGTTTIFGDLDITGSIGGAMRIAYINGAAPGDNTVDVFLDTDTTGEAVVVTCFIVDGSDLSSSTPRLSDGDIITVVKIGGTWYCTSLFFTTL